MFTSTLRLGHHLRARVARRRDEPRLVHRVYGPRRTHTEAQEKLILLNICWFNVIG